MIGKLIAATHLFVAFFYSLYAFIIKKNFLYDYFYITALIVIQLSWIVYNHECPFSYYYKAIHYDNYTCGDTTTLDDFKELDSFSKAKDKSSNNSDSTVIIGSIFTTALILSITMVAYRTRLANPLWIIFVCIFLRVFYSCFNDAIGYDTNSTGKYFLGEEKYSLLYNLYHNYGFRDLHDPINGAIAAFVIGFWIYITCMNWKRIWK
jgi:hypothetical protein